MTSRLVSFAGTSLLIEHTGDDADEIVDILYRHIANEQEAPPHVHYRLGKDEDGLLLLTRNDQFLCRDRDKAILAERLLGDSSYDLADRVDTGLLFHAAGLSNAGKGVLLAGSSGTGKTTLASYLLSQGFNFLSDEFIFLPDDDTANSMHGLTRPLNIKKPSKKILEKYIDFAANADAILSGRISHLIPPERVRAENRPDPVALKQIVFPRYTANAEFSCTPLAKAEAGLELMQCLLNARNLPAHGFHAITSLVRRVPACTLTYSDFSQFENRIKQIFSS